MTAIGPFLQETTVAFDRFGAKDLFLIHGPTGIGKSFIFDAICYALYGECPSRREANLKSDHARPDIEPSIAFAFSVGGQFFEAKRTLAYFRTPKKKTKSDFVAVPETAELAELAAWPHGERQTLATKKADVGRRCIELMGLDANQFSQVVLLPQGEFRKLLLADTQERERLLARLFGAGIYEEIERELNQVAKREQEAIQKDLEQVQVLLGQARDAIVPDLLEEEEQPSRETLRRAVETISSQLPTLHERVQACSSELNKSSEALEAGRNLQGRFDKRAELASRIAQLNEEKERDINGLQQALNAHREAAASAPLIEILERARQELGTAEQQYRQLRDTLQGAEHELEQNEVRLRSIEQLQNRQAQLSSTIDRLQPLLMLAEELDPLLHRVQGKQRDLTAYSAVATQAQARAEGIERALLTMDAEHQALRADATALADAEAELGRAQNFAQLIGRLADLKRQTADCESRLAVAQETRSASDGTLASLRQRRERGLAGELASGLKEGEPCPVCGSTEHPRPATRADDDASEQAIQQAEKRRDEAFERLQEIAAELGALRQRQQETRDQLEAHDGRYPDWPQRDAQAFLPVLLVLERRVEALQDSSEKAQHLKRKIEQVRAQELPQARENAAGATADLDTLKREVDVLQAKLEEKSRVWRQGISEEDEARLPAARSRKDRLRLQLAQLEAERGKIPREIESLQAAVQKAHDRVVETRGKLTEKQGQVEELGDRTLELENRAKEAVAASRFGSIEELKASHKDQEWLQAARAKIGDFEKRQEETRVLFEQLEIDLAQREPPDLALLEQERGLAEQALREATRQEDMAQTNLQALRSTQDRIQRLDSRSGTKQRRLEVLGKLDKQVRGLANPRISLQRFFLAQRLEEVLTQASHRLRALSGGRFILKRALTARDARAAAGLDLNIFDSHTGTERPARTLSGGQMFLASLSLALGLADVVQARSGGTTIEALFIDEGFGSLDEETLELALEVLNQLRRGRMVGVISHLPELRRQVASRVEVRGVDVGSAVRLWTDN